MLKYRITIEVVGTNSRTSFEREGIENALDTARGFMWRCLPTAQHTLAGGLAICSLPGCLHYVYKSGLCVEHYDPQDAKA
jgi:hypothetical protein